MPIDLDEHSAGFSDSPHYLRRVVALASRLVFALSIAILGVIGVVIHAVQRLAGRRPRPDEPVDEVLDVVERVRDAFQVLASPRTANAGGTGAPSRPPGDRSPYERLARHADGDDVTEPFHRPDVGTISGHCAAVSVPDFLSFLQTHEKSGVLRVTGRDETFSLEIERGELVHATSDNSPPHLLIGEILAAWGFVEREVIAGYLASLPAGVRLGEALERDGKVTREQLLRALQFQAQQHFNRLAALDDALYCFVACGPPASDGRLRLNMTSLLIESAMARDETA
jgi:hypothetical protein